MNKNAVQAAIAAVSMISVAIRVSAAGFSLYEGSASGNADTAGLTAKGGEPSAMYFNPAAITGLKGQQIQFGFTAVAPHGSVEGENPYTGVRYKEDAREKVWPLPHLYYTKQLNDGFWFGLGAYTRAGLGSEFSNEWFGRYNSSQAAITTAELNPVIAWRVNDWLSVSAGLSVNYFDIVLKQNIDVAGASQLRNYNDPSYSPYDVKQRLEGDDITYSGDFGIQLKPVDRLYVGAAYHGRVAHRCTGEAEWDVPGAVRAKAPGFFNKTDITGKVTLPDMVMLSVAYDFTGSLTLGAGATFTRWSTYDMLRIVMEEPMLMGRSEVGSEKKWEDCWRYTFGGTYKINDMYVVRAAYTFDDSPLHDQTIDYLVPADDRHIFAVGLGWTVNEKWSLDFSYFYEIIEDLDIDARVTQGVMKSEFVDGDAHSFGVTASYRF